MSKRQVEEELSEKKLRPISDAIDSGNQKLALKLISAAITKHGKKPILLALQGLALAYSGHQDEAMDCVRAMGDPALLDMQSFHTLTILLRATGAVKEYIDCYEALCKKDSKNEDNLIGLYFAYARAHEFTKMQQLAMKLYTTFKRDKYLIWSAVNVLLVLKDSPSGPNKMYQLVEMMIRRTFNPIPSSDSSSAPSVALTMLPEDLLVFLRILTRQCKWDDAVALLDSPSGLAWKAKDSVEYLRIKAQVLTDAGKLSQAAAIYKELLSTHSDDWYYLSCFLSTSLGETPLAEGVEIGALWNEAIGRPLSVEEKERLKIVVPAYPSKEQIDQVSKFFQELRQKETDVTKQKRGLYLVDVSFTYRLWAWSKEQSSSTELSSSPLLQAFFDALVTYFAKFGHKTCFLADVSFYVHKLPSNLRLSLAQKAEEVIQAIKLEVESSDSSASSSSTSSKSSTSAEAIRKYQLEISAAQLMRLARTSPGNTPYTEKELENLAKQHYDRFQGASRLVQTSLESSERGLGDPYMILFAETMLNLYDRTKKRGCLVDAVLGLEMALKRYTKHNYQIKLWLIRLYSHPEIGAIHRAVALHRSLEIKQIQCESIGHLLFSDRMRYAAWGEALFFANKTLDWHSTFKGIEDFHSMQLAFNKANYSKVLEFVEFYDRVTVSMQASHCFTEKCALNILHASKEIGELNIALLKMYNQAQPDKRKDLTFSLEFQNEDEMKSIFANNDYTVITSHDARSSLSHTQLNRPAPSCYPSSFHVPNAEPLVLRLDDSHTHEPSVADKQYIRLKRLFTIFLLHILQQDAAMMRKDLTALKDILSKLSLMPNDNIDNNFHDSLSSFQDMHWRLIFLIADTNACVTEGSMATHVYLEQFGAGTDAEEAAKLEQHTVLNGQIQRQLAILSTLTERIVQHTLSLLTSSTNTKMSSLDEEGKQVVFGAAFVPNAPINPQALADLAAFVSFEAVWLVASVQAWVTAIPSKKSFKKRKGKGDNLIQLEQHAVDVITQLRTALATLIKTLRNAFNAILDAARKISLPRKGSSNLPSSLSQLSISNPSSSSSSSSSTSSSTPSSHYAPFGDYKSSIYQLATTEAQTLLSQVRADIDDSYVKSLEAIAALVSTLDTPLEKAKGI